MRNFRDGSTILQKTHHRALYDVPAYMKYSLQWRTNHIKMFEGRAVVVVRNPFKAILSYWNYISTRSHTASANNNSLLSPKFRDFGFVGINRWYEVISDLSGSVCVYVDSLTGARRLCQKRDTNRWPVPPPT